MALCRLPLYNLSPGCDERSTLDELQMLWMRQVLDGCDTGDLLLHPEQELYGRCGVERENEMRFGSRACNETFTRTPRSELCIYRNSVVLKVGTLLGLHISGQRPQNLKRMTRRARGHSLWNIFAIII